MKKFAVVGKDVSRSLSPQIHAFLSSRLGYKLSYDKVTVAEEDFESRINELLSEYDGLNLTIPYKITVIPHLEKICGDAKAFGAVNTVLSADRSGHNTDGLGFMHMLKIAGIEVKDKRVLVIGAGGAGRSSAIKLSAEGAHVSVYSRRYESTQSLVGICPSITPLSSLKPEAYDLIVNATGVGMHKTVGSSPVGEEIIKNCSAAADLIYNPEESEFLRIAKSLGKRTVNGKAMLFFQAYFAECVWFQIPADLQTADELYKEFLKEVLK